MQTNDYTISKKEREHSQIKCFIDFVADGLLDVTVIYPLISAITNCSLNSNETFFPSSDPANHFCFLN